MLAVGSRPPIGRNLFRLVFHSVIGFDEHLVQLAVHLFKVPEFTSFVLQPLEIANDHATRVAQNVRDYVDFASLQNCVTLGVGRPVGAFCYKPHVQQRRRI